MLPDNGTNVSHKTHYARLGHAAQHLLPSFLQEVLLQFENPSTIYARCNQNSYLIRQLSRGEMKILRTAVKDGYTNFDIPFIYSILRNLHGNLIRPTKGWEHPTDPLVNEIEIGDDLERCRRLRNEIIHRGNTIVTDQELHRYFNEFKTIARRFEMFCKKNTNEFVSEVDNLRTCCMDEATEQQYSKMIEDFQQNDRENKATILDLKNQLKEIQDEKSIDIQNLTSKINMRYLLLLEKIADIEGRSHIMDDAVSDVLNTGTDKSRSHIMDDAVSDVLNTGTDKNVWKCRVEWRLEMPNTWYLQEIKDTLERVSHLSRQWFEIEFVYTG